MYFETCVYVYGGQEGKEDGVRGSHTTGLNTGLNVQVVSSERILCLHSPHHSDCKKKYFTQN